MHVTSLPRLLPLAAPCRCAAASATDPRAGARSPAHCGHHPAAKSHPRHHDLQERKMKLSLMTLAALLGLSPLAA
jgi:hypothetical protein